MSPTSHELLFGGSVAVGMGIPRAVGKDILAPFVPVWSQPLQKGKRMFRSELRRQLTVRRRLQNTVR